MDGAPGLTKSQRPDWDCISLIIVFAMVAIGLVCGFVGARNYAAGPGAPPHYERPAGEFVRNVTGQQFCTIETTEGTYNVDHFLPAARGAPVEVWINRAGYRFLVVGGGKPVAIRGE